MEDVSRRTLSLWSVGAGVLLGVAFMHPWLWWTVLGGLALLWHVVVRAPSASAAFWFGTLAGSLKMTFVLSWFWTVYPLDWLADFNPHLLLLSITLIWLSVSVVIGVGVGAFAYSAFFIRTHRYRLVLVPSLLVLSEVIGSLVFSVYSYGEGASVNAHFSFGYLGYALAQHDFLGLFAVIGGVYVLTYLVGMGALFFYNFFKTYEVVGKRVWMTRFLAIVVSLSLLHVVPLPLDRQERGLVVSTVNTDFDKGLQTDLIERVTQAKLLFDTFTAAISVPTDYVIFPETADAFTLFNSPQAVFAHVKKHTSSTPMLIDSNQVLDTSGRMRIRTTVYDTKTHTTYDVYKKYLIPNGEFLPYFAAAFMKILGFSETALLLDERMAYRPHQEAQETIQTTLPILFCSESVSPFIAFAITRNDEFPFIVHQISHGWFHAPAVFWYQLDLMLRTQVRFAGVPLVQAANRAAPRAYDTFGFPIAGETVFTATSTTVVQFKI